MDYNKIGMFTTKRFHKWEGTSFLNNHKEQNEYKDPNSGLPNRWKNKQFETQFPKIGHDSFFRRITYASDPYPGHKSRDAIDSMRIENGFGTSSNRANGNFMNVAGQGAWKQRIRKERNAIRRYGSKFPRSTSTLKAQGQALGKIQRQPGGTIGINLQTFKNSSRPATTTPQRRLYDIYHDVNFEPKTYVCV